MKKIILFVFSILAIMFVLISCRKEKVEKNNILYDTTWTADYIHDNILVIQFTSNTEFQEYMANSQGHVCSTGVDYGTYSLSDNKITFLTHTSTSPFDFAAVNGNVLELTYKSGYKRTFIRK